MIVRARSPVVTTLDADDLTVGPRPDADRTLGAFNQNPPGIGLLQLLREDFDTHDQTLFSPGLWAIAVHRFGNWRMGIRSRWLRAPLSVLYRVLYRLVQILFGIKLGYTVRLGRRVRIWHMGGMVLGALSIGDDIHIRQNVTFGLQRLGDPRWLKPVIVDRCDIGAGAVIVGGIEVGPACVIGANVVLSQSIPAGRIVTVPKPRIRARSIQLGR